MKTLHGMTWDHVRGIEPLIAATKSFNKNYRDVEIIWDKRSLKDFEDYPIELLCEKYDLILLDHPCIGRAVEHNSLIPISDYMIPEELAEHSRDSVGPTFDSYTWMGKQWALPVDTAAQVSAYRNDLVKKLGLFIPTTWDEVIEFAKSIPSSMKLGFPLNSTHAFCSFLSLCANIGGKDFWDGYGEINLHLAEEALELLINISKYVHESSFTSDPIQTLDMMSRDDEIIYAPLIFGYINYSYPSFRKKIIHFRDMPSYSDIPRGSVIGGVGIGVSSKSLFIEEAVNFARFVSSADCQCGLYFDHNGQPAHRKAWINHNLNEKSGDFFKETLKTVEHSYMRPRYDGFLFIQEKAGEIIRKGIMTKEPVRKIIESVNQLILKKANA